VAGGRAAGVGGGGGRAAEAASGARKEEERGQSLAEPQGGERAAEGIAWRVSASPASSSWLAALSTRRADAAVRRSAEARRGGYLGFVEGNRGDLLFGARCVAPRSDARGIV
jgi:hypothetical protein